MTDKSAFKISDYFWPLGVGMLTRQHPHTQRPEIVGDFKGGFIGH